MLCAGLLLRLFHLLYNCDVVEEEVYHSWKEDIAQDLPGKEKALFQVGERVGRVGCCKGVGDKRTCEWRGKVHIYALIYDCGVVFHRIIGELCMYIYIYV